MFKKGHSGNPGGRPKLDHDVKKLARQFSKEAVTRLAEWMRDDNPKASVAACVALLDRAYGKPAQSITGGDPDDLPIRISLVERVIVHAKTPDPDR